MDDIEKLAKELYEKFPQKTHNVYSIGWTEVAKHISKLLLEARIDEIMYDICPRCDEYADNRNRIAELKKQIGELEK